MMHIENNSVFLASNRRPMFDIMTELMNEVGGSLSKYTWDFFHYIDDKGKVQPKNRNIPKHGRAPVTLSVVFPIEKLDELKIELAKYGEDGQYFLDTLED